MFHRKILHSLQRYLALSSRSLLVWSILVSMPGLEPVYSAMEKEEVAGLVLKASGQWNVVRQGRTRRLSQGDVIPNGWSLKSVAADSEITVVLVDGRRFSCPGGTLCGCPLVVDKSPSAERSWVAAAISVFNHNHDDWVVALSRGKPNRLDVQDSVLVMQPTGVDLSSVMKSLPDGTYHLQIKPVVETISNTSADLISFNYKNAQPTLIELPALKSGLYRIQLSDNGDEPAAEAWILLTDPTSYPRLSSALERAKLTTIDWNKDVTDDTVRSFLRAYMVSLNPNPDTYNLP